METINILIGMLIGLALGTQLWWNEREYRKTIEKYREEAVQDAKFWEKLYDDCKKLYDDAKAKLPK